MLWYFRQTRTLMNGFCRFPNAEDLLAFSVHELHCRSNLGHASRSVWSVLEGVLVEHEALDERDGGFLDQIFDQLFLGILPHPDQLDLRAPEYHPERTLCAPDAVS